MKRYLLSVILLMQAFVLNAQQSFEVVFIGTSKDMPDTIQGYLDGFYKLVPRQHKLTKDNSFTYYLGFNDKNFTLKLRHVNYKEEYSKQADLQTLNICIDKLSDLGQVIEIDEFISSKSQAEVLDWALGNIKKKIWVIDRRDFYKSDPKLSEPDMMKVVQCEIWMQDLPYLQDIHAIY